ncbi:Hypothetical protein A7A1_3631 [Bacillus subtilis subsp. subtilis str. BSP1]|nr:Hypothetical protein A7A1_3631 [Bacillus subtilis subsp. subtilis str. BSP1]
MAPRVVRIHLFCDRPLCAGRVHFIQRQKTQSSQPAIQKTIARKKPENAPAFFCCIIRQAKRSWQSFYLTLHSHNKKSYRTVLFVSAYHEVLLFVSRAPSSNQTSAHKLLPPLEAR